MELLVTHYSPTMVALSFVISVIGSFIALTASQRMVRGDGSISLANTVSAGVALGGIGVWAMHFIGMLSLKLPIGHGYSMVETGVSLLAAAAASGAALAYVARAPKSLPRLVAAGVFLGLGVCFMHYLGMYGMRFGGYFAWSYGLVALSCLIAVVAATVALWLAFNTRGFAGVLAASCVMGIAVCAMHYTGMSAADFICTTDNRAAVPSGFGVISSWQLPTLVIFSVVWMAAQLALDQVYQSLQTPLNAGPAGPAGPAA